MADWGFQVEDELLRGQLFSIYLAHFCLQFVYLLDFWADGRLENIFELSGLISNIILQNQRRVLQTGDLTFDNFSQVNQIVSIEIDSISQKSTHLLHQKKDTSSLHICSVRFISAKVCSLTSKRIESSILGSFEYWVRLISKVL